MPILTKPSSAACASLLYVTIGVLTGVWSGVWYWYMTGHPPENAATWYWCYGFLLTGLALLVIGLAIGPIGRAARHAELPPAEVTPAETNIQRTAASHPPAAVPLPPNAALATAPPGNTDAVPQAKQRIPVK